jgi:hypothetical protein
MARLHKTSVYLSDAERGRLRRLADETGRSQADLLREAVATYDPHRPAPRRFSSFEVAHGPGDSVADLDEDALLEGFGEQP